MKSLWPDRFNRAEVQGSLFLTYSGVDIAKGQAKYVRCISRLFSIYLTITRAKNVVRCTENFLIERFVISKFYCISQVKNLSLEKRFCCRSDIKRQQLV